jgi:hypothetical protein
MHLYVKKDCQIIILSVPRLGVETDQCGSDSALPKSVFIFLKQIRMRTDNVEYECGADVIRIRIRIGYFFNMERIQIIK